MLVEKTDIMKPYISLKIFHKYSGFFNLFTFISSNTSPRSVYSINFRSFTKVFFLTTFVQVNITTIIEIGGWKGMVSWPYKLQETLIQSYLI